MVRIAAVIPAIAAATPAVVEISKAASGIVGSITEALNKDIYSHTVTTTQTRKGKTTVTTDSYALTTGMVLGGLGILAAWEVGQDLKKMFGNITQGIDFAINPIGYIINGIDALSGVPTQQDSAMTALDKAIGHGITLGGTIINAILTNSLTPATPQQGQSSGDAAIIATITNKVTAFDLGKLIGH